MKKGSLKAEAKRKGGQLGLPEERKSPSFLLITAILVTEEGEGKAHEGHCGPADPFVIDMRGRISLMLWNGR